MRYSTITIITITIFHHYFHHHHHHPLSSPPYSIITTILYHQHHHYPPLWLIPFSITTVITILYHHCYHLLSSSSPSMSDYSILTFILITIIIITITIIIITIITVLPSSSSSLTHILENTTYLFYSRYWYSHDDDIVSSVSLLQCHHLLVSCLPCQFICQRSSLEGMRPCLGK